MHRISKSQIFYNVICMGYLNHKYFYQGYSMDILFQSARRPCCLGSLAAPSGPGRHGPLSTILCQRSSVSATDRPPRVPDEVCPVQTATTMVDLVHVASLPTQLFLPDSSGFPSCPTRTTNIGLHLVCIWFAFGQEQY